MHTPRTLVSILLTLGLGLSACGSSEPSSSDSTSGGEATGAQEGQEHPELPPDLAAYHDTLAPLWHQDAGEGRARAACENAQSFNQLSANVENGDALRDASRHLAAICGSGDTATIEEALSGVHQAFHDVMEAREGEEEAPADVTDEADIDGPATE